MARRGDSAPWGQQNPAPEEEKGRPQCLQPSVVLWFPWILDVHKTSCQLPACHVGEALRDEHLSESEVGWWGPAQLPVILVGYLACSPGQRGRPKLPTQGLLAIEQ